MRSRNPDGSNVGVAKGKNDIARHDLTHEIIEGILGVICFALG